MSTIHNFHDSLQFSHEQEDQPWWEIVYREAFPTMIAFHSVRQDGWAQRGGIDRKIILRDGTDLHIDEKTRKEDWPDILIEIWSDASRKIPGWGHLDKELTCDYIAYAMVPSQTCYLLPYPILRRAMKQNQADWCQLALARKHGFRIIEAENNTNGRTWKTASVAVPTQTLLNAIRDCLIIRWATPDDGMLF